MNGQLPHQSGIVLRVSNQGMLVDQAVIEELEQTRMFRILIVEDNDLLRKTLGEIIAAHFPTILIDEAEDAETAAESIEAARPDFILMDIRLPGRSGLELTKEVKSKYPEITIAILTAYDMPEYLETAMQFGADRFMIKGLLSASNIIALIESVLAEKG